MRPVLRVEERRRWDALVAEHHYLPFRGLFGKALRQVAVFGDQWLALLGWHAGAFKVGVRDQWIGWSAQRQFRRLHLLANNARFVVLEAGRVPNLASRVLGLSLRRLAGDMEAIHEYPLSCYLAIAIAARLAGYRGVTAMGEFAALLDPDQLRAVGAFRSPSRKRYTAPAISTFRYILTSLPPETLDRVLQDWTAQHLGEGTPVAMDGKDVRGAAKALPDDRRRMLVAAVEHGSGLVLGQVQVGDTTNEITAVRELAEILDLHNRTVTLDAMHVQQETARCLIDRCRARLSGDRSQEQPGNPHGGPAGHRLEQGPHLAGTMAEGAWPHRAASVRGGGRQRPGVGRLCRSLWTPAGVARGAGTSCPEPQNQQHGNRLGSHVAVRRHGPKSLTGRALSLPPTPVISLTTHNHTPLSASSTVATYSHTTRQPAHLRLLRRPPCRALPQEELDQLAAGSITAADHDRLEDETGK